MVARAVHVAKVNLEKSKPLDLQGLPSGGDSWTRTNGLPSVGQLRNIRNAALPLASLVCSARFRLASSRTAGARLRAP